MIYFLRTLQNTCTVALQIGSPVRYSISAHKIQPGKELTGRESPGLSHSSANMPKRQAIALGAGVLILIVSATFGLAADGPLSRENIKHTLMRENTNLNTPPSPSSKGYDPSESAAMLKEEFSLTVGGAIAIRRVAKVTLLGVESDGKVTVRVERIAAPQEGETLSLAADEIAPLGLHFTPEKVTLDLQYMGGGGGRYRFSLFDERWTVI